MWTLIRARSRDSSRQEMARTLRRADAAVRLTLVAADGCAVGSRGHCVGERWSYTDGMKTAISLPDAVFLAAERQAKRSRKSRSQLYAEALAEYLSRHAPDEVTAAMNRVVDHLDESPDPYVLAAARSVLQRVKW